MKPFNLQRQFMGFLLLGAQRPIPHNLPQPWLSPWSCAAPGAGSSAGAQMRWRWAPLPRQHCRPPRVFLLPMGLAPVEEGSQGTCPACHVAAWGRQHGPFVHKPPGNPMGLNWRFRATPISSQRVNFFLSSLLIFRGKGCLSKGMGRLLRGRGNLLGAAWPLPAAMLWCRQPVRPPLLPACFTCYCPILGHLLPPFLLFLLITWGWGSSRCSGCVQSSRLLPQKSPSTVMWASVSKTWETQSAFKNQ